MLEIGLNNDYDDDFNDDDDDDDGDVDGDMGRKAAVEVVRAAPQKCPHFQIYQISRRYLEISRRLNARNISIPDEKYFPPKTTNLECPFMGEESKGVSRVAAKNVLHTVPHGLFFTTNDDTSKVMIYHLTRKRLSERARNCKRIPNWTRCSITKRLLKRDIRRSSPIYSRQRPSSDSISVVIFEPCHLLVLNTIRE